MIRTVLICDLSRSLTRPPVLFSLMRSLLLSLILLVPLSSESVAQRRRGPSIVEPIDLPGGSRVELGSFQSTDIGGTEAFSIFLPPSYSKTTVSYPVVYFLHGLFNDHTSWASHQHGDIPAVLDQLMVKGRLPELVIVFPDGDRSFYTNFRNGGPKYEDLIVDELPDYIESHYRIKPGAENRAIAGTSMGGYGALKIAMRHPDRYAAVAAHSPIVFPIKNPLDIPEEAKANRQFQYLTGVFAEVYGDPFDQAYFDENNPLELASKPGLDGLGIYFDYGTNDRYNQRIGLGKGLEKLDAALTANGVAHVFRVHEGEPHGWALVYAHIQESLSYIAEHLAH
jgi:S-formylglutathione hydrolase FrmB